MFFKYNKNDKIFYEKYGNNKKTIIILPGWGNNRRTFHDIITFLKEEYTIYIFDYPGFGNSPLPTHSLSIYDYSKIIKSFIEEKNIKNPILIGHSFGGRIIITLSGFFKIHFDKIILISSAGIYHKKSIKQNIKQIIYKILKRLCSLLPQKIKKLCLNKLIQLFGSSDYKKINESLRNSFINIVKEDLTSYLKYISSDTLLIWGEKDESTPLSDAYIIKNNIRKSKLVTLENCSHFCYLEEKEKILELIYNFIKKD